MYDEYKWEIVVITEIILSSTCLIVGFFLGRIGTSKRRKPTEEDIRAFQKQEIQCWIADYEKNSKVPVWEQGNSAALTVEDPRGVYPTINLTEQELKERIAEMRLMGLFGPLPHPEMLRRKPVQVSSGYTDPPDPGPRPVD